MSAGIPFGPYLLVRRIARGGMAEVFLAQQRGAEGFERKVALKRILPHLVDAEDFLEMFTGEARLAAQLAHPNIAHVYDFGKVDDYYFLAMEYVRGVDCAALIRLGAERPVALLHAARIAADVCAGLDYAHRLAGADGRPLGIVHRDVSPQNILVSFDGLVKLVDFGIAKAADQMDRTRPGVIKGKFAYLSPEQAEGRTLDGRSDVFNVGIVLYELLSGAHLFSHEKASEAMRQVRGGAWEPIETRRPDTPPALARIVRRALAVDRSARYPSAGELQLELEQFLKEGADLVTPAVLGRRLRELFPEEAATGELSGPRPKDSPGTQPAGTQPAGAAAPAARPSAAAGAIDTGETTTVPARGPLPARPTRAGLEGLLSGVLPSDPLLPASPVGRVAGDGAHAVAAHAAAAHAAPPAGAPAGPPSDPRTPDGARLEPPHAAAEPGREPAPAPGAGTVPSAAAPLPPASLPLPSGFRTPGPLPVASAAALGDGGAAGRREGERSGDTPIVAPTRPPRRMARRPEAPPQRPTRPRLGRPAAALAGLLIVGAAIATMVVRSDPGPTTGAPPEPAPRRPAAAARGGAAPAPRAARAQQPAPVSPGALEPAPDPASATADRAPSAPTPRATPDVAIVTPPAADPSAAQQPPQAAFALLDVLTDPAGAEVRVDGQLLPSRTPLHGEAFPEGTHQVEVVLAGRRPVARTVELEPGETRTLELVLPAAPRSPPPTGLLTLRTVPWAEVYLGSRHLGTTPLANVRLPAGRHSLTLRNPARPTRHVAVTIRPGALTKLDEKL